MAEPQLKRFNHSAAGPQPNLPRRHGGTEKSKTLPLMTLMKLMDADSKFHHRSTQINTDHCWGTMPEIPSHDEKNFRNSNARAQRTQRNQSNVTASNNNPSEFVDAQDEFELKSN